jgi:hypothetical protein
MEKVTVTSETNPGFAAKVQTAMDANPELAEQMKPKRKPVKVQEYLRYDFSQEELRQKAKDLALSVQKQARAQEEQKAAQAQFKQRIEFEAAQIAALSNNISMGWDMRNIDCEVQYHTPSQGWKRTVRLDTREVVNEVAMSTYEMQEKLFEDADAGDGDAE